MGLTAPVPGDLIRVKEWACFWRDITAVSEWTHARFVRAKERGTCIAITSDRKWACVLFSGGQIGWIIADLVDVVGKRKRGEKEAPSG